MRTVPSPKHGSAATAADGLHPDVLNPARLLQQVAAAFRPAAASRGLELMVEPCFDWHDVVTDDALVRQIVGYLLGDAIAQSATGSVRLAVTPPNGAHWGITIVGAAPAKPPPPPDGHRAPPGAGLNWTLCKELVERLNGKISRHGTTGRGTHCKVTLPVMVRH